MERKMQEGAEVKKKLSYEELENVCKQLSSQSEILYKRLQESNMVNMFKRLDYLFKVVEHGDKFSSDFVIKCAEEIENSITPVEKEDEEEDTDQES